MVVRRAPSSRPKNGSCASAWDRTSGFRGHRPSAARGGLPAREVLERGLADAGAAAARLPSGASAPMLLADPRRSEAMDEDRLNIEIRKFLKEVGVTSQREIERVVREGRAKGPALKLRMVLTAEGTPLEHVVERTIEVG
jgi:hypothetical protein